MTTPTPSETSADRAGLIPIAQAAALLMISPERVRQLVKEGYIPRAERGMVALVPAVQGYIRARRDAKAKAEPSAEAAAVMQARADEIRGRIERERASLIAYDDSVAIMAQGIAILRAECADVGKPFRRDHPDVASALKREVGRVFAKAERAMDEGHTRLKARAARRRR